jgi:hypothetical protein
VVDPVPTQSESALRADSFGTPDQVTGQPNKCLGAIEDVKSAITCIVDYCIRLPWAVIRIALALARPRRSTLQDTSPSRQISKT